MELDLHIYVLVIMDISRHYILNFLRKNYNNNNDTLTIERWVRN